MLGRGLESLIPPNHSSDNAGHGMEQGNKNSSKTEDAVFQIEVGKITPNPYQPRREFDEGALNDLAASIREMGIIQPLIVSKIEKETDVGTQVVYQIIAGERRWLAAKRVGLERVPAIVRSISQEREKLEIAIVENIQRADLNPLEAARSYAKLQEKFGLTQREVAAKVGRSRETIANVLRLLNLPGYIQEAIGKGQVSDSQGRLLLAVSDPGQQKSLFEEITINNLSVRELKARVAKIRRPVSAEGYGGRPSASLGRRNPELVIIEERLKEVLGTKVSLQNDSNGGKITISFFSPEEFQAIISKLIPNDSQLS